MSKNHSGRPLNVNHHTKKLPKLKHVTPRTEGFLNDVQRKAGKGK